MERAGRLIGKLKLPEMSDPETRARAAWAMAAGKKIAEHTRATVLVRDTLVVEVEDYVWQKNLATLERFLIENLAKAMGEAVVKKLDLRPMPRRRAPQRAETARPDGERIDDPVLDLLYRQSKR
jgi:predicted nucleic acid-binding Zn ribbon protein